MIQFGIDILLQSNPQWKDQKIGLVTNHAATTNDLTPTRLALQKAGYQLQTLFSPEHGLDITGADGHAIHDGFDALTGLPVVSLYDRKLAPSAEDLDKLDILLFDIPDVGSRFYTYLWTLTYVMESCAANHKKLVILDRPNPISGRLELAEGPILEATEASFIGRWEIPIRHSCTLGELAFYFKDVKKIHCDIEVIRCKGWERNQMQSDWGVPFVPTSPAITSFQSMLMYPGLCLLEATNISEGRGTAYSFTTAGAPWIDGHAVAKMLNEMGFDDVKIKPVNFTPTDANAKFKGIACSGIQMEVMEPAYFQPVFFGLVLIRLLKQMYPTQFEWKPYVTMVNPSGRQHLDKLMGIPGSEQLFELPFPKFMAEVTKITQCRDWVEEIEPFLLYG